MKCGRSDYWAKHDAEKLRYVKAQLRHLIPRTAEDIMEFYKRNNMKRQIHGWKWDCEGNYHEDIQGPIEKHLERLVKNLTVEEREVQGRGLRVWYSEIGFGFSIEYVLRGGHC